MRKGAARKILICEDDSGISEIFRIILQEWAGFEVRILSNGKTIHKTIRGYAPHVILLDIWMPGSDGREVTKVLKKDATTKHIPIIIVSAFQDVGKIARDIGADDFIPKPFTTEEVLGKVNQYIMR